MSNRGAAQKGPQSFVLICSILVKFEMRLYGDFKILRIRRLGHARTSKPSSR